MFCLPARSCVNETRYSIRVGRSRSARGPFVDREGKNLLHGGGELVYGSNRDVYAPGGQGVLREADGDILYYHYCVFLSCLGWVGLV